MPFQPRELAKHFIKHGTDFGATNSIQYEAFADRFMTSPLHYNLKQCERRNGDIVRYDVVTEEFGVLAATGILRTYYKPVRCADLPPGSTADCHNFRDNLTYFNYECAK